MILPPRRQVWINIFFAGFAPLRETFRDSGAAEWAEFLKRQDRGAEAILQRLDVEPVENLAVVPGHVDHVIENTQKQCDGGQSHDDG